MKVIAIAAVTAGGKTTIVNKIKEKLPKSVSLHFDDYSFEGEVDNFYEWVKAGANYNVWNLTPLLKNILELKDNDECEYLLLDYPFAYCNSLIEKHIDYAIFIDTSLDIALARGVLRDMRTSTGDEIRNWLETYLSFARVAYVQMQNDIRHSSDYVIDGDIECNDIVDIIIERIIKI